MSFAAAHFGMFAAYNAWANERLYAACARLPAAEYLKARPAFFRSLHGTLNHVLVGDRVWMARFEGRESGIHALDQILHGDLESLREARRAEDSRIVSFIEGLSAEDYERDIDYRNMSGQPQRERLGRLLAHFFNHQTHHRGQAHDQLSQTSVAPPELDLIFFLREAQPR
jgi:uncharacterized damage-inducible protein DinB